MHAGIASRYAIVTPAKNEVANVPRIVESIAAQTLMPACWFFIDDNSTDGTGDLFLSEIAKYPSLAKACNIVVSVFPTSEQGYALGTKYSSVVRHGFDKLEEYEIQNGARFDYIGILDCDVFPESNYYEAVLHELEADPKLGIASGGTQIEVDGDANRSVRVPRTHSAGMMRIWRRSCFDDTGYFPSFSQDSVSEARAIMMGWRSRSFPKIRARMRKMGANVKYEYYGKSAYVRWVPYFNALLHATKLRIVGKKDDAVSFLKGYRDARNGSIPRLNDPLVKRYFRWRLFYKLLGR